jgi:hypothetical protein
MKGYAEERGLAFKLAFDAVSGQFVSQPIAHDFQPKAEPSLLVKKLADLRKTYRTKKVRDQVSKQLAAMGPELRDDIGMTDVFATSQHF